MPVKVVESNLNVLQAAKIRIRNVFANGWQNLPELFFRQG